MLGPAGGKVGKEIGIVRGGEYGVGRSPDDSEAGATTGNRDRVRRRRVLLFRLLAGDGVVDGLGLGPRGAADVGKLFDRAQMLVRKLLDLGVDGFAIDFRGISACVFQRGVDSLLELIGVDGKRRLDPRCLSSSSSAASASATDVSAKLSPTASTSTTMRVRVELLSAPLAARFTVSIIPPVRLESVEFVWHFGCAGALLFQFCGRRHRQVVSRL